MSAYTLDPVGFIRPTVKGREDAPRQGPEGPPEFSVVRTGADQGCERLVEAQRFDVTVELAQRVEPFRGTPAGVTHEIIKPILACADYKGSNAIGQSDPPDQGIAVGEFRIDHLVRRQIFVDVPNTFCRK